MGRTTEMVGAALSRIWASRRLWDDFSALCACGGRFAGTNSEVRAREFLAGRMAEATGVTTIRKSVPYLGWARGPASITLPNGASMPASGLVRTPSTPPEGICGRLVDLARGTPDDVARLGHAVRGAIVLVQHEFMMASAHVHRRRKYECARAAGAAGFIIAYHEPGCLIVTGSSGNGGEGYIPALGISHETGVALSGFAGQEVRLHVSGSFKEASGENLFAAIPGAEAKRVMLSAHYDGHDPGTSAIDNASGVVAAIAAAEALRDIVPRLPRGLELALFTVEEWALIGSQVFLDTLSAHERAEIVFNLNLDAVAGDAALTVITGGFPGVGEFIQKALRPAGLAVGLHHGFMANSDHANFVRHGIPAVRLCAGFDNPRSNLRFLLTAADTQDKVHPHELKAAASVAAVLALAACADPTLPLPVSAEDGRRIAESETARDDA